jgi:hypothetical protein
MSHGLLKVVGEYSFVQTLPFQLRVFPQHRVENMAVF